MNDPIVKKLEKFINFTEKNKSSHWKHYLNSKTDFYKYNASLGFGSYSKKGFLKKFLHSFMSRIIFDKKIFLSNTYQKYKNIFDQNNRQIDVDTIRHIYTFNLLLNSVDPKKIKKICLIGDGKSNGLIGSLLNFPLAKIYSINLAETLINDYILLKKMNIFDYDNIRVIENKDDILKNNRIFIIPSNLKALLNNVEIDLFINIASFQEMEMSEINNYFEIIKSNKSLLYCCNREHKKLPDGKDIYFNKYPWGNGKKILLENCMWHQKYYLFKYPFVRNYDGNIKHCLIDYNKKY